MVEWILTALALLGTSQSGTAVAPQTPQPRRSQGRLRRPQHPMQAQPTASITRQEAEQYLELALV